MGTREGNANSKNGQEVTQNADVAYSPFNLLAGYVLQHRPPTLLSFSSSISCGNLGGRCYEYLRAHS